MTDNKEPELSQEQALEEAGVMSESMALRSKLNQLLYNAGLPETNLIIGIPYLFSGVFTGTHKGVVLFGKIQSITVYNGEIFVGVNHPTKVGHVKGFERSDDCWIACVDGIDATGELYVFPDE